jgi:hypothetical protein
MPQQSAPSGFTPCRQSPPIQPIGLSSVTTHRAIVIIRDRRPDRGTDLEVIACMAVNDPFVMAAWGQAHKADGKITMLAGGFYDQADNVEK